MRRSTILVRFSSVIVLVFTSAWISAARAEDLVGLKVRAAQTWTISQAPPGAWDVYLTGEQLDPGFWTGPHTHPGPECGMTVGGQVQIWDHGTQHGVKAGEGYFISTNVVHEAGNQSSATALLLSAHLIPFQRSFHEPVGTEQAPSDAPKAAPGHTRLWQVKFAVSEHPSTPFSLIERIVDVPPSRTSFFMPASEMQFVVVMEGMAVVTQHGVIKNLKVGQSYPVSPNASFTVATAGIPATLMNVSIEGR